MTFVIWTPHLLGEFLKAISAARDSGEQVFDFVVDTRYGKETLQFSLDFAEYLSEHLTDASAANTATQ